MTYTLLYTTHVTCAALSISLFLLRAGIKLATGNAPTHLLLRVAPHAIDTLLLAAAIGLTLTIGQYPFIDSWLTVKFFALIAYIILGSVALKRAETPAGTAAALASATVVFGFIVSVAWYHHPYGIGVWLFLIP